ncbi:PREDICTED: NADPH oxidase 5 isoform X1 [Acromyrmex echinatior]|uniref:NADPH oxidase 5 n=1 Tax=Acromyrmex echinatior TaxID=103372 RepID=F4WXH6_ACREC|nr:PREDICTED: NADPH oxidase 5 isoform X1 [Acromyrmex echinatior]XP_011061637.1 PREDICTED: NADPH oxidase 5 isoform X1 [Acromyrmex echinatior]EGI61142.1 NADPH oxidase 5 [Acromyrmex echinatior]
MEGTIICMEEECLLEKRRTRILKECKEILQEEGAERYSKEAFRRLFHDQMLLGKLFILFDQDCDGLLKQDEWLEFLKGRLTNEKQNDFVDQIESVAYVLCGENPINLSNFRQIFYTKGIIEKLYRLIDHENSGYVTPTQILDMISGVSNTRPRAGFDKENLEWLEKIFKQTVGNEGEICREEFKTIVTSKNPFFTERVFQIFDKDNSGTISLQEFLDAMHQFAGKSMNDKIRFLFKVYDIDGDGLIQLRELEHVMRACMEENGMKFSDEQIEDLTIALFEEADQDNRGAITFEGLKKQLEKHEGLLENLSTSIDRWLVPPQPKLKKKSILDTFLSLRPYQLTKPYMKNNYVFIAFISMFMLINVILFVSRLYKYRNHSVYIMFARACGQCLNFDCTFILVLMLRQCITFLRTHSFNSLVPLDHHIYLHKMTGILIGIFSIVHTVMHLIYCGTVIVKDEKMNNGNYAMFEWLLTSRPGYFGLIAGSAYPTGVILFIILVIMIVCSMSFVRRGGCFEIFYWSHLLYIPFWILMIFHGPNFWKWFVGPGIIYLVEKIRRLGWLRSQRGKTYISSGLLLPSKVTHLVIKRPTNFHFHPGDYVFVKIPVIAKYEWHPFTISSAPEQEDYMWLHIRAVGEWTNSLYSYFEKEQIKLHCADILPAENCDVACVPPKKSFISGKKTPLIMTQKASMESQVHNLLDNPSFVSDLSNAVSPSHASIKNKSTYLKTTEHTPESNKEWRDGSVRRDKRLHQFFLGTKIPLEKSHSMPDMQIKNKKKERLAALRKYMRSESERNFDECQMKCARFKSLGLAYLSPQNKSLAQSFRYMRTKPTIIAFKTPSFETGDYEIDALSSVVLNTNAEGNERTPITPNTMQIAAEEGKLRQEFNEAVDSSNSLDLNNSFQPPINYPVGKPLEIFLDGPYGAPSSHIFRAQHAVLIATGIGVTPFASILQSIMHRYWKARHTCPKCSFSWAGEIPTTVMNLRKVDFFWINRNQRSFEWFVNLLSQLEIEQAELGITMERFLEMHMYITSALQKSDMKAVGLQLALDLLHEKEKRDLITGLKTRTNAGRPNWDKVFKQLQDKKKGKITVFFCGPPQLARILRYKCDQFGFCFRKESF